METSGISEKNVLEYEPLSGNIGGPIEETVYRRIPP